MIFLLLTWNTAAVTSSDKMFYDCTKLEGAQGTAYDASHVDASYAHIDGGPGNPGYLTDPNAPVAYACYTPGNTTLTFYYDNLRGTRPGTTYFLNTGYTSPGWRSDGMYSSVTRVIFHSDFSNARPTSTYRWFCDMQNLETITGISSLNTSEVTEMRYMFYNCSKLTSIDLSHFNTSMVTNMGYMFSGCSALTRLDVCHLNTDLVTDMRGMFSNTTALTSLYLIDFNTAKVTNMSYMFYGCSNMAAIYVDDTWNTAAVTSSGNMFYDCTKLLGAQGTAYDANHIDAAYAHVDGGTANPGYFTEYEGPEGYACYMPNGTMTFYYDQFRYERTIMGGFTYGMNSGSNNPDWYTDGMSDNVKAVVFNRSFADYYPSSTFGWFATMSNLTSIQGMKEYLNTSEVTKMNGMFSECSSLTSLDLSNFNTANVTNMTSMFSDCSNLTTIFVGDRWSTNNVTQSSNMFTGCTKLVGYLGTTYDANHIDAAYAHVDGGPSNPGYLTDINGPYAALSENGKTLTFYCDKQRDSRPGKTYDLNEPGDDPEWYGDIADITTVVFDSSFANARPVSTSNWFFDISTLTNIIGIEYLNTSRVTNMSNMFHECERLTSIDLSHFDTGKVTNMNSMFGFCKSLTSLDLSSFNTENVTDMGNMFSNCSSLTSIAVGHLNTLKVTDMSSMFYGCSALTNIDFTGSGFQTGIVTNMSGMFWNCQALTAVNLSGFDTRKVTTMNRMFQNCSSLTRLDLSIFNTENVEDIGWMFAFCSSLTSLDVSNFNTSKVKNLWSVFFNCSSLRLLDLTSFNTSAVTLTTTTFSGCSNLKTVYVGDGWDMSKVTTSPGMFTACTSLVGGMGTTYDASHVDKAYAHIDGGPSNPGYFTADVSSYAVYDSGNTTLTFYHDSQRASHNGATETVYSLNEGNNYPEWYDDGNFDYVKTVVFDESFAEARPTSTFYWFGEMFSLTSVVGIEYLNTSEVTNMKSMFSDCRELTSLDVSGFDTRKVTDMSWMFYYCAGLKSLDVSGFDTQNVTDMSGLFSFCQGLTELDVSHFDTENVTNMGSMFYYCEALTSLDLSSFNTSNVTDFGWMFHGCSGLTSLDVTEFDTSNATDMRAMFTQCRNLSNLDVTGFDTHHVEIMYKMFSECTGLTMLDLSSFNTSALTNTNNMFENSSNLNTIYVGEDWTTTNVSNSNDMFKGCTSLVGGQGTTFDASHVDKAYAHIDGGTDNPGYFSEKPDFLLGDVNDDGSVTIADVTALVNIILGKATVPASGVADVNKDGSVTIADVTALVNIILGKI